jgi:hypothetical protein
MTMWWLSFRHGDVVVIKASSLVHARLLAARNGLGRASHFVEGYFIDPARMMPIPHEYVGRMLSPRRGAAPGGTVETRAARARH